MTSDATEPARPRLLLEPQDLVGYTIDGRFRLNDMIGEGGMGVVYRSRQEGIDRDLAIKILKPGQLNATKRIERFEREISIISSLSHPNIVRIFDSGRDPGLEVHYIAMELVNGVSLDTVLRGHLLKVEFALEVAYQICGALAEPHARGIIHRDIKPENTLIVGMADETVQVKVLDFGIAKSQRGDGKVTTTGVVIGTPRYMAPESVQGGEIDERTDLYAVGVMLYQMLVGEPPFTADTPVATMIQHVTREAPELEERLRGFEYSEVSKLVRELMAKDPVNRPQSAREARTRIDEVRDLYGFGRLKLNLDESPLRSLETWLLPREAQEPGPTLGDTESWATANSFELTRKLRTEAGQPVEPESGNLIPVPEDVARRHLEAMGKTADHLSVSQEFEVEDDDLEIEESMSEPSSRGMRTWMLAALALLVVGLGALIWNVSQNDSKPVELGRSGAARAPAVESKVSSDESVASVAGLENASGALAHARALAIVATSHAAALDEAGTEEAAPPASDVKDPRPRVATKKPEAEKQDESRKAQGEEKDDFQKGLEWLRDK